MSNEVLRRGLCQLRHQDGSRERLISPKKINLSSQLRNLPEDYKLGAITDTGDLNSWAEAG